MFDNLHVMYIISFIHSSIHLLEIHLFAYSLNLFIYLFMYLIKHSFICLLNIIYFVLAEIE